SDKGRLPERLKEFGRFEQEWETQKARNPEKALSKEAFLDKNVKRYPDIQQSRTKAATEIQRESSVRREKDAQWAPSKAPAKPEPAPVIIHLPPRVPPTTPTPQQPPRKERPSRQINPSTPDVAKDYHRQIWEQIKPATATKPRGLTPNPSSKGRVGGNPAKANKVKPGRN
ncbi:MAG TPA: hypothetical protein DCF33_19365, partial [Saprospirales bacterium]|nr:hypothetical protein [Saprospirales bacterium]